MNTNVNRGEGRKLPKPNNIITVSTSLEDFFKWWCTFLYPLVPLTNRQKDVVSCLLKKRWELSKAISDPAILDSVLMSNDIRKSVLEECKLSLQHYYVVMGELKKNRIIENNILNPRLIPNIRQDDKGTFQLLILFKENSAKK